MTKALLVNSKLKFAVTKMENVDDPKDADMLTRSLSQPLSPISRYVKTFRPDSDIE
jgi:hypothetical protein